MHTMNNSEVSLPLLAQLDAGLNLNLNGEYVLIRVSGADAKAFLHTQFTQDIAHLGDNDVRLGGYCSAKGRLYAIFYTYAEGEEVFLLMHHSVAETVIKRLRMFVLRMKATLDNVSAQYHISGFVGPNALANGVKQTGDGVTHLGILPSVLDESNAHSLPREIRITPQSAQTATDASELSVWHWLDIHAGMAHVTADISEAFVPQMMNLERIGGVNFKKGCYPGQEIVARSHYLGKLKRRMQSARIVFNDAESCAASLAQLRIGMDVYSSADPEQPAGQLLAYARNPFNDAQADVLYEVSLPLLDNDAQLSFKEPTGGQWQRRALPYSLSDPK